MKKKWFFGLIFIAVAVVLVIVFINLFTSKSTKPLAEIVNTSTQSGYLDAENKDKQDILDYLTTVGGISGVDTERIATYKSVYVTYEVVGDFYNREIVFAKYCDAYKKNRKTIIKEFEQAQKAAKDFASYIRKNEEKINGDQDWLARSWKTGESYMKKVINQTTSAFNNLAVVYGKAIDSQFHNNAYTQLIFDGFKTLSKDAFSTDETVTNDEETLKQFVSAYFNDDATILNYVYNTSLQEKVANIKEKGKDSIYYDSFIRGALKN